MKIRIMDISERTGYSIATVSNALNNKPGVSRKASTEIFEAAQELGYVSGSKITRIRFVTFRKNGLIVDDAPFFRALIESVESEARLCGYEMVFNTLFRDSSDFEAQLNAIKNDATSALILLGTEMMEDDYVSFVDDTNPVVILDGWCNATNFDCVIIDNTHAASQAASYLLDRGHTEIGYLKGKFRINNFVQRSVSFQHTLRKRNCPLQSKYVVRLTSTIEGAYQDMRCWLQSSPTLPTAFLADNDVIALGALRALREVGYNVPGDISVIGFDDLIACEASVPRLTTVHVFTQDMGRLAVRRLVDTIKNEYWLTKANICVCTKLVERDSVLDIR